MRTIAFTGFILLKEILDVVPLRIFRLHYKGVDRFVGLTEGIGTFGTQSTMCILLFSIMVHKMKQFQNLFKNHL